MKVPIALRIFLIGTVVLLVTAVPIPFNKAFASNIIFQDNFDDGNADGWTPLSGNALWQVKDISGNKMYGARIETQSTGIESIAGDTNWTDYQLEMDMYPIEGADKNIQFRWNSKYGFCNQFHFNGEGLHINNLPTINYVMSNGTIYHIKIILEGPRYQLFINGTEIADVVDPNPLCLSGSIGLTITTGAAYPTEVWFDNIVVTSLDGALTPTPSPIPTPTPIPTATPIPTPTPTQTPSPTPTPIPLSNLNVPVLRQTDKPWGSQVYDGANFWSPLSQTIKNWGCALTSYAMVLKYFGINKLPNGTNLDPGTLNTWLKNNNGYIDGKNSGYLNPLAISSLSKKAIAINNITSFDGLEYSRITSSNNLPLINELNNNRPAILEEPGHFIVANGIKTNTFNIIDPYFTNRTDLTSYNNTFISLNKLLPSNTDLSYILVAADKDVDIGIEDSHGNAMGEQFLQQPLVNDENNQQSGELLKMDYLQKSLSGEYKINLKSTNTKNYDLEIYLYDKGGNVDVEDIPLILNPNKSTTININFDGQNANHSKTSKIVTFDSLISDIKELKSLRLINAKVADKLIESVIKIKKDCSKKFKILTEFRLRIMNETLRFYDKRFLSQETYRILSYDIKNLINSL